MTEHREFGPWPPRLSVAVAGEGGAVSEVFRSEWSHMMKACCEDHSVWQGDFASTLLNPSSLTHDGFELAAVWAINMVIGSYCFPRYVAALAARAEQDAVRHGLLENAWDESGSYHHRSRSHFWLAIRLARLLGLTDVEIEGIQALPEAAAYTDEHFRQCAEGDFGFALGMICLIEEFTTPEFTMIFRGLLRTSKSGIDIDPDKFVLNGGAEYFTANISDDQRHREEMPRLVAVWLCANGVDLDNREHVLRGLESVHAGAMQSANLRQNFFKGIYNFVKLGGTHKALCRL